MPRRKIDDAQSPHAQTDTCRDKGAFIVWTAVPMDSAHRAQAFFVRERVR
jgi:hypothetical protein